MMLLEFVRGILGAPPAQPPASYGTTATLGVRAYAMILLVFVMGLLGIVRAATLGATEGYAYAVGGMVTAVVSAIAYAGARVAQAHAGQYAPRPAVGAAAVAVTIDPSVPSSAAGHEVYPEEARDL